MSCPTTRRGRVAQHRWLRTATRLAFGALACVSVHAQAQTDDGIRFSSDAYVVNAGDETAELKLLRPIRATAGTAQVFYEAVDDTAQAGLDFKDSSGSVTWDEDDFDEKTVTIDLLQNTNSGPDRSFTVELTDVFGDATIAQPSASVEILGTDNINPGQVRVSTPDIAQVSATSYDITFVRERGSFGEARVRARSSGGNPGADHTPIDQDVVWADGEAGVKTVTLDNVTPFQSRTEDIRITVSLSSPQGGIEIVDPTAIEVLFVAPQDPPPPQDPEETDTTGFLQTTQSIPPTVNRIFALVKREGDNIAGRGLEVEYSVVGGTAVPDVDFPADAAFGTLVFGVGEETSKPIEIPLNSKRDAEKTMVIELSAAGNQLIDANKTLTATIAPSPDEPDSAEPVAGNTVFADGDITVPSTATEAVLIVERSRVNASDRLESTTIDYRVIDGNTSPSVDYTTASAFAQLIYGPNEDGLRAITIDLLERTNVDAPRTFTVALTTSESGATQMADVTILPPPEGPADADEVNTVGFPRDTLNVSGAASRILTFVERKPGSDGALSISYRPDGGTAQQDVDYQADAAIGTLTWGEGESGVRQIDIPLLREITQDKTLVLSLFGDDDVIIDALGEQTITISRADAPDPGQEPTPGEVSFLNTSKSVPNNVGVATVLVERTGQRPLTEEIVDWRIIDRTTAPGVDYDPQSTSGQLSWPADETGLRSIQIPIIPRESASSRSFRLELRTAIPGDTQLMDVTIQGAGTSESQGSVGFTGAITRVAPSASSVTIPILRSKTVPDAQLSATNVNYQTVEGTARQGEDYVSDTPFGTFTWEQGEGGFRAVTYAFPPERQKETELSLVLSGSAVDPAKSTHTIVIEATGTGADREPGMVEMDDETRNVGASEGVATVGISRRNGADGPMAATVVIAYTDGTVEEQTVEWADGESGTRFVTINLPAAGFGEDQTISVSITNATGGRIGAKSQTRLGVEIADGSGSFHWGALVLLLLASAAARRRA